MFIDWPITAKGLQFNVAKEFWSYSHVELLGVARNQTFLTFRCYFCCEKDAIHFEKLHQEVIVVVEKKATKEENKLCFESNSVCDLPLTSE